MECVKTALIRALNDELRALRTGGTILLTNGISALGPDAVREILLAIARFNAFDADNDPYDEHDFGALDVGGERIFWKIDYYDPDLTSGAEDPANANCRRVLTVMLAEEY